MRKFSVIGPGGELYPNLRGVFRREFPIAVGGENPVHVTYYGVRYTITPDTGEETTC